MYERPTGLDSSLTDVFSMDKQLYRLPLPVRTLLEDGWSFAEDVQETVLRAGGYVDEIVFVKEEKQIVCRLANYSIHSEMYLNTFVVSLYADIEDGNPAPEFRLGGDIDPFEYTPEQIAEQLGLRAQERSGNIHFGNYFMMSHYEFSPTENEDGSRNRATYYFGNDYTTKTIDQICIGLRYHMFGYYA